MKQATILVQDPSHQLPVRLYQAIAERGLTFVCSPDAQLSAELLDQQRFAGVIIVSVSDGGDLFDRCTALRHTPLMIVDQDARDRRDLQSILGVVQNQAMVESLPLQCPAVDGRFLDNVEARLAA